jgi:hypothetical protein
MMKDGKIGGGVRGLLEHETGVNTNSRACSSFSRSRGNVTMAGATGIPLAALFVVSTARGGGLLAIRAQARGMEGATSPRYMRSLWDDTLTSSAAWPV